MQIKINRASVRNRHSGKFIDNFEALQHVEQIIYNEIKKQKEENKK